MALYELHEFDKDKVFTGEIKPSKVAHIKYNPYEKNSVGQTVIDINKDLSHVRNFINLNTTKASQEKFNQVVDIEIKEFLPTKIDTTITDLSNKVSELEGIKAELQATNASDIDKINRLNEQIKTLESKAKMAPPVLINKIPDTLFANAQLRSGTLKNKLLSKNRQAVALLDDLGAFTIYTGQYDENGNPLPDTTQEIQFQKSVGKQEQTSWVKIGKQSNSWGDFINNYGIWPSGDYLENSTFTFVRNVYFEQDGAFTFKATADDACSIYIDGKKQFDADSFQLSNAGIDIPQYRGWMKVPDHIIRLTKGWHVLKAIVSNSGGPGGLAITISQPDGPLVSVTKPVTTKEWVNNPHGYGYEYMSVTKNVTTQEPSYAGKLIWDTDTYKEAYSKNSDLPITNTGAPYVVWVYSGATDNDGQGQLELVRTTPIWEVTYGSGRVKLTKAAKVILDDNGILNLYEGKSLMWTSYAY